MLGSYEAVGSTKCLQLMFNYSKYFGTLTLIKIWQKSASSAGNKKRKKKNTRLQKTAATTKKHFVCSNIKIS
jgi:hypothetical protein